jgi:hypothetical protein
MDSGKSELPKAWHTRPGPIEIESGIRGPVSHAATTVTDVAINRAGRKKRIARPMGLGPEAMQLCPDSIWGLVASSTTPF